MQGAQYDRIHPKYSDTSNPYHTCLKMNKYNLPPDVVS